MWVKRAEWINVLTESSAAKAKVSILEDQCTSRMDTIKQYASALKKEREKNALLSARASELEKRLIEMQDLVNKLKTVAPKPINLAEMFEEEDPAEVERLRQRIKEEGADAVLAEAYTEK